MRTRKSSFRLWFNRVLSHDLIMQILLLVATLVFTFLLSHILFAFAGEEVKTYCQEQGIDRLLFPLYLIIDGNAFNDYYTNDFAPVSKYALWVGMGTYVLGVIVFTGMIISVLTNMIDHRIEDHRNGMIHYLKSGHYLIMGYDDMVPSIIKEIFKKDSKAYILMLSAVDANSIKEHLEGALTKRQMRHIINNYGHRISKEFYGSIHVESARDIYIVGQRSLPAHDAFNVECVGNICSYLKGLRNPKRPKRIICVFEDLDTYAAFKTSEIFGEVRELGIEFIPYNFYEGWAKQVFAVRSYTEKNDPDTPIPYPTIFGRGITPTDHCHAHLVFVGTTNFAVSFAMEAAHLFHFPNFEHDHSQRTRITFIDLKADEELPLFITRNRSFFEIQSYRYLDLSNTPGPIPEQAPKGDFLDVEFEFIKGDVFSERIQNLLSMWANDESQRLSIFLAMNDQRNNFIIGMNMPNTIYDNEVPVFIRQDRADRFVTKLREANKEPHDYRTVVNGRLESKSRKGRYAHLYPFGMDEMAYCNNERLINQAKLINYLYSNITAEGFPLQTDLEAMAPEAIWKDADAYWEKLSVANQWSSLYNAYNFPCKLSSLRAMRHLDPDDESHDMDPLSKEEIYEIGMAEHNRWNVEKLLMGYRKPKEEEDKYAHPEFADVLKGNKKLFIHHDIRPFEDLDEVRDIDFGIVSFIPWILRMTSK